MIETKLLFSKFQLKKKSLSSAIVFEHQPKQYQKRQNKFQQKASFPKFSKFPSFSKNSGRVHRAKKEHEKLAFPLNNRKKRGKKAGYKKPYEVK